MMIHKGTQPLQTQRLVLRQILPSDAQDLFAWMGNTNASQYERWRPHPSPDYSRGYITEVYDYSSPEEYQWGLQLKDRLIGSVSVVGIDNFDQKAVLGYITAPQYWSKGYTTEAVQAVLRFMFTQVKINRIEASHAVENIASGYVLRKAGFIKEGHAKDYYLSNNGFLDSDLYGLTKKQYLQPIIDRSGLLL